MKRYMLNLLGVLAVGSAFNLQVPTASAQSAGFTMLTITNPTPEVGDSFGVSVAPVGADRVLIGAYAANLGASGAGAAYLFSTNGALLTTFTNPTPAAGDYFGVSVAAVGNDRVLIGAFGDNAGATDAGAAYLFDTDGTLLTTFAKLTPAAGDAFGHSVAAVGTDRVLIGVYSDDTAGNNAGAAYLFSTNGKLLTTFTKPAPAAGGHFGRSVAAVGSDRVLIGAPYDNTGATKAGAAYLFRADGALLATFTNPTPATNDYFGFSVAAAGTDRVLIGAHLDDEGATDAGAAYLFSTNGALLTTFTNPTPAYRDFFGRSVAAVGDDRVLIGAEGDDTGASSAGAAYLFSTNGVLLKTFTNSAPADTDYFGASVAAAGTDRVLIGASGDDTGAENAGVAYLFSLAEQTPKVPRLAIRLRTPNTAAISWPSPSTGWTLQQNTNGVGSVNWSNAPGPIQDDGTTKTLIINPATENRFYRLFKP